MSASWAEEAVATATVKGSPISIEAETRTLAWMAWRLEVVAMALGAVWVSHSLHPAHRTPKLPPATPLERLVNRALILASGFLDPISYVQACPGLDPQTDLANDFLDRGVHGFDPGPRFSSSRYLERYPDVAEHRQNPLIHFIRHGIPEGRFDTLEAKPAPRCESAWPAPEPGPGIVDPGRHASHAALELLRSSRATLLESIESAVRRREEVELDLYVSRTDVQRAISLNDVLMRKLADALLKDGPAAQDIAAQHVVAVLQEDLREANRETAYWRSRAEVAERSALDPDGTGHGRQA